MSDNLDENNIDSDIKNSTDLPTDENEIQVRFEVGGKPLDLDKVNRVGRRLLEGQAKKYKNKYKDVIGSDGERPTVVIRMVRLMDKKVEVVLEYPESMKDTIKGHEKSVRVSD